MKLRQHIQEEVNSEKQKALLNILYTASWINMQQLRFFKQFDLSPQQYNVLRVLRGQCDETTVCISTIREQMMDKTSNVSRLVEKLRQHGLVGRSECAGDRRQMDVKISRAGLELLNRIDKEQQEMHEVMTPIDNREAGLLNEILDKLKNHN